MEKIISEDELTDMFGEGGKEEVKEFYEEEIIDKARKEGWNDCIKEYEKIKSAIVSPMKILDEVKRRERQRVIGELENWINRDENWTIKQLKEIIKKIK